MKITAGEWRSFNQSEKAELLISKANRSAVFFLARQRQLQRKIGQ